MAALGSRGRGWGRPAGLQTLTRLRPTSAAPWPAQEAPKKPAAAVAGKKRKADDEEEEPVRLMGS
jgi:hypothetical protein